MLLKLTLIVVTSHAMFNRIVYIDKGRYCDRNFSDCLVFMFLYVVEHTLSPIWATLVIVSTNFVVFDLKIKRYEIF